MKVIQWGALALVVAALAVVAALYLLASRLPEGYAPARLTQEQRNDAAAEFFDRPVAHFYNDAQKIEPFVLEITQDEMNRYLASMDEINAARPDRPGEVRRGQVQRKMDEAGLAEPAVLLADGTLTVMVRSREHSKVLSAELAPEADAGGTLRVRLLRVRVGRLTVPDWLVRDRLDEVKRALAPEAGGAGADAAGPLGPSSGDVARAVGDVIAAIDEKPIPTEIEKYRIRLAGVEIEGGVMRLRFVPTRRKAKLSP